jgi:hypothetical protein
MHDIGPHTPFSESYPPPGEVMKWLNGRTIHEACMTPEEIAAYLGKSSKNLWYWRRRRVERTPPWFRFLKKVWYSRESLREFIQSVEAVRI